MVVGALQRVLSWHKKDTENASAIAMNSENSVSVEPDLGAKFFVGKLVYIDPVFLDANPHEWVNAVTGRIYDLGGRVTFTLHSAAPHPKPVDLFLDIHGTHRGKKEYQGIPIVSMNQFKRRSWGYCYRPDMFQEELTGV